MKFLHFNRSLSLHNINFGTIAGLDLKNNEIYQADYKEDKAFSAKIFKTIADPFIGNNMCSNRS